MLSIFDALRGLTLASVALRLLLALLCGGLIGMERAYKHRPAGFRTHILICLGASMTTLTSQYLYLILHYYTDMARLGAQVIAGIGFIGAGTIIVTRHNRVTGLTTAAGLWASAIVGLALGGGFYEGGILATAFILFAEIFFSRLEFFLLEHSPELNLYLEYRDQPSLDAVIDLLEQKHITVAHMQIALPDSEQELNACSIFTLRLNDNLRAEQLLTMLRKMDGVLSAEKI